jgi:LEA14-like dessication related protein
MRNIHNLSLYLSGILFLILLQGCKRPEAPVFETIREITIKERTKDSITLTAYADFYNPNNYKMVLKKADIDLLLNGKKISSLHQEFDLVIDKKSDFTVPIDATFSRDQINDNLISSALNILLGRKLTVNYVGNIKVKAYGIRIRVPVEGESKIDIRDL